MTWRPVVWLVALTVIVLDFVTKQWALAELTPYEVQPLLGDFLSLQLVFNSGAAFSFGAGFTWVVTIVMVAITAGVIYYARRAQPGLVVVLFGIGLGGAIGNLIDRLFRAPSFGQGHVVDMINYNNWFVGNVADIAIVGAAAVILLMTLRGTAILKPEPHAAPASESTSEDSSDTPGDTGSSANDGSRG